MASKKVNIAVIGGTGYTGFELVRLLAYHPHARIKAITSRQYAGKPYSECYGAMRSIVDLKCEEFDPDSIAKKADAAFVCLPHGESMGAVASLLERGLKVIDLSADFRLGDPKLYGKWYKKHEFPKLLKKAVYGLPELHRKKIKGANLVANPGCYPTSVILAAAPLFKKGLIAGNSIIADCKSGASGAGRGLKLGSMYCEVNESLKPYAPFTHRHEPEMEQELGLLATGKKAEVGFIPHLVPMNRGILASVYGTAKSVVSVKDILKLYKAFYKNEPFVRVLEEGELPDVSSVRGSNYCDVGVAVSGKRIMISAAIDNLGKGASSAAVQNFNIMCGFNETAGLTSAPLGV